MKAQSILSYFLISLIAISCMDNQFDTNDLIVENDINYLHPSLSRTDFPNDKYRIVGITPVDEYFNIIVEYPGGCEEHHFYTWWDGNWSESSPPRATFYLSHSARGDNCDRSVRDTVRIELNKVFGMKSLPEEVHVRVRNGYSGKSIEVDPFLASISQSNNCDLEATLNDMICLQGIWDQKGFLLLDSVAYHDSVWIQPVKNMNDVTLDIPGSGKYLIGITPVFGFDFTSELAIDCETTPERSVLPASINCIRRL